MSPRAAGAALSLAQAAVSYAKAIQDDANAVWLPPAEIAPARTNVVVPFVLVKGTRPCIEKVVHQINGSYENTYYDACAVMMRRLVEILIIEAFEAYDIADHIKGPSGEFMFLGDLINAALGEKAWNLGRQARGALKNLKTVGDKSAHGRRYNAVRQYIDELIPDIRTVVHELVSLSRLK